MRLPALGVSRAPTDTELVNAIRAGDATALGLLLERHRPRLFAAAMRRLGYRPDAEDVVQETCLIAMEQIGAVRDPEAIAGWLHAVLRRACLQHRRRHRAEILMDSFPDVVDPRGGPEDRIERSELRDWIRGELDHLPQPLRVTVMLRYFGSYDSYDEVAAILGVPVGTVRSRLSEARARLADAMLASAGLIDDETRTLATEREQFWADALQDVFRRGDTGRFIAHFPPDLLVKWSNGTQARGRHHLAAEIDGDIAAGVRVELERVIGGRDITVVEGRFVNPPDAPEHCPPGLALVLVGKGASPHGIHVHLSRRLPRTEPD